MKRIILLSVGWVAVGCALIGLFLPIIPTVPFLLVALWAFGQSSERLRQRILSDPVFGPDIRKWQERGAIRRSAKIFATLAMAGSVVLAFWFGVPILIVSVQSLILFCVAIFIVSRPEA
ncbi:YbaN family protein [Paracoccus albus]|uniref:YbaN family protein n=1 Tax=Paracoccus albus TaxID=3017784 RepID=UPI0022EFF1BB|nr:YbaN family protein [Paracoccus albus]WBU60024.1 YbaN family protein [Paracoccus albus]